MARLDTGDSSPQLANFERRYHQAGKRDPSREIALADDNSASAGPRFDLAASSISPSKHAVREEEEAALAQALTRLPEDYRRAVLLRNQQGMSFEAMGRELGRSADAARKLWARAIEQLQQIFESTDGPSST